MCLIVVVTRQLTWQYVIGLQYKSPCVVTETVTLSHLSSMQNYCNNNARKWQTLIVSKAIARKFLHQKGLRAWSSCSVYGSFVEIPFYIFIHCSELQFLTSLKNIYLYTFSNFLCAQGESHPSGPSPSHAKSHSYSVCGSWTHCYNLACYRLSVSRDKRKNSEYLPLPSPPPFFLAFARPDRLRAWVRLQIFCSGTI